MPADTFPEYVQDQLRELGRVTVKRMFSGHGVYFDGVIFAIVNRGSLFFKVDDESRPSYEALGSEPFKPLKKLTIRSYYEVPADVIEDPATLAAWARRAMAAQAQAQKQKRRAKPKPARASRKKLRRPPERRKSRLSRA
ncbi:MAG: TfoX/Sxy family protein [Planctomycetota bacterium]|nr:TfoX/Sxy family protein [Planctomycetota bacterium]